MNYKKGAVICLSAALWAGAVPFNALAGSPEFAYTAEKWASLRDNLLEYGELADLVHEYNTTVIQNQIEYEDYRGESKDDLSDDYYDAANELYDSMDYPDSDSADYGSSLSSYLNRQLQAENLQKQGDDNVDDGDIKKWGYDKTEASLVKQAQELMISYWSQSSTLKTRQQALEQAQSSYDSTALKVSAGMATQSELLSAQESVTNAQANLLSAQTSLDRTKENLCLMLGWTYGAEVEIGQLPTPDLDQIGAIDLAADVETGLAANYDLKILERQVSNAVSSSNKANLQEQYKSSRETTANSIQSAYNSLMLAKSDYDQANQTYALEQQTLAAASRRLQAGIITRKEYEEQERSCTSAEVSANTAQMTLLQSYSAYQWAVNGLTS